MKYFNLTQENINKTFSDLYREIESTFECTYLFYKCELQGYEFIFASNMEWMDLYVNQSLIKQCPLFRVGVKKIQTSKTKSVMLRWNDVKPISRDERNIVGLRNEFNICNGISLGRQIGKASDYLGLAADRLNFNFPSQIIRDSLKIREIMNKLFNNSLASMLISQVQQNINNIDHNLLLQNNSLLIRDCRERLDKAQYPA